MSSTIDPKDKGALRSLVIELKKGHPQKLQFLGWKTPREENGLVKFYALKQEVPFVVKLDPELDPPDDLLPRLSISEADCVKIQPCRLIPPKCFRNKTVWVQYIESRTGALKIWIEAYQKLGDAVIYRSDIYDRDDDKFEAYLSQFKEKIRLDYNKKWEELDCSPDQLGLEYEDQRRRLIGKLDDEFHRILSITLDDAKKNKIGILDSFLIEEWADQRGINLEEMEQERVVFCRIMAKLYNVSSDQAPEPPRSCLQPRSYYECHKRFSLPCGLVRHRAFFADGDVLYLKGCELDENLTDGERREVDRLRGGSSNNQPRQKDTSLAVGAQRATAEVSTNAGVDVPTSVDPYRIERLGATYVITFAGEKFTAKADAGMAYIVTYFQYSKMEDDPLTLYLNAWGLLTETKAKESVEDNQSRSKLNQDRAQAWRIAKDGFKKLKRLGYLEDRKACETNEERDRELDLDDKEAEELALLRRKIGNKKEFEKYILEKKAFAEGRRFHQDDRGKKHATMLKAINRTLKKIRSPRVPSASPSAQLAAKKFTDHVRRYLTDDHLRFYDPPPGVSWIFSG